MPIARATTASICWWCLMPNVGYWIFLLSVRVWCMMPVFSVAIEKCIVWEEILITGYSWFLTSYLPPLSGPQTKYNTYVDAQILYFVSWHNALSVLASITYWLHLVWTLDLITLVLFGQVIVGSTWNLLNNAYLLKLIHGKLHISFVLLPPIFVQVGSGFWADSEP